MAVIAILNFSGNVGKSTVANQLLRPRLPNYKFFSVESINTSDSPEDEMRRAHDYNALYEEIMLDHENAVLDIGASNIEDFMIKMSENVGSHDDYDLLIIPIVPDTKQINDTINTIESLNALGVSHKRIVLMFNRVDSTLNTVEEQFKEMFFYHKQGKKFTLSDSLAIYESDIFNRARFHDKSIYELANDKEDYKKLSKNPELPRDQRMEYVKLHSSRGLAIGANGNLDDVFLCLSKLFKF